MPRDFLLLVFFHESVSPQPQSIPLGPFQIFSENSRRYSRVKVHNRYQRHRWPVSTTPAANFATNYTCVVDNGGKFATGVNDTGGKFAAGVNDTGGKLSPVSTTLVANLPPESGAWGKLIHEKN